MPGDNSRDVTARLTELEATVRGLTQELVSANERIRTLEAALDDAQAVDADAPFGGAAADGAPPGAGAGDEATKATTVETDGSTAAASGDDEAEESGTDPDDIIVA